MAVQIEQACHLISLLTRIDHHARWQQSDTRYIQKKQRKSVIGESEGIELDTPNCSSNRTIVSAVEVLKSLKSKEPEATYLSSEEKAATSALISHLDEGCSFV